MMWSFPAEVLARILPLRHRDFIRLKLLFISNVLCQKYNKFYLRFKEVSLAPFSGEESEHDISVKESLTTLITMTWSFPAEALARILPSRHRDFLG